MIAAAFTQLPASPLLRQPVAAPVTGSLANNRTAPTRPANAEPQPDRSSYAYAAAPSASSSGTWSTSAEGTAMDPPLMSLPRPSNEGGRAAATFSRSAPPPRPLLQHEPQHPQHHQPQPARPQPARYSPPLLQQQPLLQFSNHLEPLSPGSENGSSGSHFLLDTATRLRQEGAGSRDALSDTTDVVLVASSSFSNTDSPVRS
jgi:hypothetical protein